MAIAFRAVGTVKANAGSGNLASIVLPTGHVANDILVCVVAAADNVVCTMPAGWANKLATNSGTPCRLEVWWKRDNGSEAAPTVTHAAGNDANAWIVAYSGVDSGLADPFRDAQTQTATSSLTCTGPALTGVVSGDMRIFAGSAGVTNDTSGVASNNWSTVTGFTERVDTANVSGTNGLMGGYDDLLATGAAGSITSTITWGGTNPNNVGGQLALSSASSAVAGIPDVTMAPMRG